MTPAPLTAEALVEGADDFPTEAEIESMRQEAENFRMPTPPPIPVRERYYLTECEHCGWIGSSEQCGGDAFPGDDDIICAVCCSSIRGDSPSEADTAKHGEAVYQCIVQAEAALATAEAARLRGVVEALREALKPFADAAAGIPASVSDTAPAARVSNDACHPGSITTISAGEFRAARTALARAATEEGQAAPNPSTSTTARGPRG
ncbi:hypothetical protein [Methylorubrum extorquens]